MGNEICVEIFYCPFLDAKCRSKTYPTNTPNLNSICNAHPSSICIVLCPRPIQPKISSGNPRHRLDSSSGNGNMACISGPLYQKKSVHASVDRAAPVAFAPASSLGQTQQSPADFPHPRAPAPCARDATTARRPRGHKQASKQRRR